MILKLNSSFDNLICRKYSTKLDKEHFLITQEHFLMRVHWPSLDMQ